MSDFITRDDLNALGELCDRVLSRVGREVVDLAEELNTVNDRAHDRLVELDRRLRVVERLVVR